MRLLTPRRCARTRSSCGGWPTPAGELIAAGDSEFIHGFAEPFTLSVVAELEGVPEADHACSATGCRRPRPARAEAARVPLRAVHVLHRGSPPLAARRHHDGDGDGEVPRRLDPEVNDVALLAANLFAGGQETTVRLLSFALRIIAERPDMQAFLREDRDASRASSRRRCATRARCAASSAWRGGA